LELLRQLGPSKHSTELIDCLPGHTAPAIAKMRNRIGVVITAECRSRSGEKAARFRNGCKLDQNLSLSDFDDCVFQVLIGSMLGDGCVTKSDDCKNYFFCEGHGSKQTDYLEWKMNILSPFMSRWNSNKKTHISTARHPIFTSLRDRFYKARKNCDKSIIPVDLISKLNFFGLMIWYMDDGYLGTTRTGRLSNGLKKSPQPSISAKGWDRIDLENAVSILNQNLDLSMYIKYYKHRNGQNKLVMLGKSRDFLLSKWKTISQERKLPACMSYKLECEV
jgi:hypothetical protein